ncbi:hypothetical protein L3Y34_000601 [Caenorhabditis briggsae]|uniref:Uncharacterized protein n=1 Tax=Caenorhabditis briggsae TaxID=6238 RepID=A0AAE9D9Q2_CAEBR|nr:hypothetical protein L3Y34_000601 [Caenorhabditis briggsae]
MSSVDGGEEAATSSEILWTEILCRIPFRKLDGTDKWVRIDSKNEVEEEDALQLEQCIQNQEVILSHSSIIQPQEHCRGIVEEFEYLERNIKVTISSNSGFPIWEDTDIWMSLMNSIYNGELNTSADDPIPSPQPDEPRSPKPHEMNQKELFEAINGWRLVDKKRLRMRKKEGERWRNIYLTELVMTCIEPEKEELLEFVEERTQLRFGDVIDEAGNVLVDVISKDLEQKTITIRVETFLTRDVNIPLTPERTYYLRICELEDDDLESLASEDGILPGYQLVENLDELCEKIGELTITDVSAIVWFIENQANCYIRLFVTSTRRMSKFKQLSGHHVIIQSTANGRSSVLAVVSRVFNDGMVLTLEGVPKEDKKEFFFSEKEGFTIRIEHEYEERLQKKNLEKLRFEVANSTTDIRNQRIWQETVKTVTRHYASFSVKNNAFLQIPKGTNILIAKNYDIKNPIEHKSDFRICKVVGHPICDSQTIVVELISTTSLMEGPHRFSITNAYYFVDFDVSENVTNDSIYCALNGRNHNDTKSFAERHPISKEQKFYVFPMDEKYHGKNRKKKGTFQKEKTIQPPKILLIKEPKTGNTSKSQNQNLELKKSSPHPEDPHHNHPWNPPASLPVNAKQLGFVRVVDKSYQENQNKISVEIEKGFNRNGEKMGKPTRWHLGKQVAITGNAQEKLILIKGEVLDTRGISGYCDNGSEQESDRYGLSQSAIYQENQRQEPETTA